MEYWNCFRADKLKECVVVVVWASVVIVWRGWWVAGNDERLV
jgi:hypothetical protein